MLTWSLLFSEKKSLKRVEKIVAREGIHKKTLVLSVVESKQWRKKGETRVKNMVSIGMKKKELTKYTTTVLIPKNFWFSYRNCAFAQCRSRNPPMGNNRDSISYWDSSSDFLLFFSPIGNSKLGRLWAKIFMRECIKSKSDITNVNHSVTENKIKNQIIGSVGSTQQHLK